MGRTVPTYRQVVEDIVHRWQDYRHALRKQDRDIFDQLMVKARAHASAAHYAAILDPTEPFFMSILVELQRDIDALKKRLNGKLKGKNDGV
jgi:hypothetical protein